MADWIIIGLSIIGGLTVAGVAVIVLIGATIEGGRADDDDLDFFHGGDT